MGTRRRRTCQATGLSVLLPPAEAGTFRLNLGTDAGLGVVAAEAQNGSFRCQLDPAAGETGCGLTGAPGAE